MMTALLVIDMQNDFMPRSFYSRASLPVEDADTLIPVIRQLKSQASLVVYTRDSHPPHHISFVDEHPGCSHLLYQEVKVKDSHGNVKKQRLWPKHCVKDSRLPRPRGFDFPENLGVQKDDVVVEKGVDADIESYSAFFDQDKNMLVLHGILQKNSVKKLVITGVAFDICVAETAKDAIELGYEVVIPMNATQATSEQARQETYMQLEKLGVCFVENL